MAGEDTPNKGQENSSLEMNEASNSGRLERANRLYAKAIDITLYATDENDTLEKEFEGECLNISRTGFGGNLKPVHRSVETSNLVGKRYVVQFFLPGVNMQMVACRVVRTDVSQDLRFDVFVGAQFDYPIDLSALISRLLSISR